jgi:hypothetical protein
MKRWLVTASNDGNSHSSGFSNGSRPQLQCSNKQQLEQLNRIIPITGPTYNISTRTAYKTHFSYSIAIVAAASVGVIDTELLPCTGRCVVACSKVVAK